VLVDCFGRAVAAAPPSLIGADPQVCPTGFKLARGKSFPPHPNGMKSFILQSKVSARNHCIKIYQSSFGSHDF
jgi:hypothetical protein